MPLFCQYFVNIMESHLDSIRCANKLHLPPRRRRQYLMNYDFAFIEVSDDIDKEATNIYMKSEKLTI